MTIGEPQHRFPAFVPEHINAGEFSKYPTNEGARVVGRNLWLDHGAIPLIRR
jgi:hypothetical protein